MSLATVTSISRGNREMPSERGFVNLWRDLDQQPWYKLHKGRYTAVFIHLLINASHRPRTVNFRGCDLSLLPGQIAKTYEQLARELNQTKSDIQNAIRTFKKHGQITTKTDGKYTIISVENWSKFNTVSDTASDTAKPLVNQCVEPLRNTDCDTASNTQNNNALKDLKEYAGSETPQVDFLELRENAFEHFWKTWSDAKRLVGKTNTATKSAAKIKFNSIFPESKLVSLGEKTFSEEVNSMCNLAWFAHSDIAQKSESGENSNWFNHKNMYPNKFIGNRQWREEQWKNI